MRAFELYERVEISQLREKLTKLLMPYAERLSFSVRDIDDKHEAAQFVAHRLLELTPDLDCNINFIVGDENMQDNMVAHGSTDHYATINIELDPSAIHSGRFSLLENPEGYMKSLIMTISHEMVHCYQLRKSKGRMKPSYDSNKLHSWDYTEQSKYLADPHEIQAHAKDAVDEILMFPDIETGEDVINYLKNNFEDAKHEINIIDRYWEHFGEEREDKRAQNIWNRFLKYVYSYAREIGK